MLLFTYKVLVRVFTDSALPLLRLADLHGDPADVELRGGGRSAPGHDGLHAVPHVLPQSQALPLHLEHHQVPDVLVQGYQERVGPVTRDLFFAGKKGMGS